jgi:hypothetical protein
MTRWTWFALAVALALPAVASAAGGMSTGTPDIKLAGPLTFGPQGLLFVADPTGAAVFAIETKDTAKAPVAKSLAVEAIDAKVAAMLGTTAEDILINDVAVNPVSGNIYLSVSRGRGPDAQPVIMKVSGDGQLSQVSLENVNFAKAELPNAPAAPAPAVPNAAPNSRARAGRNQRSQSITDMEFVDGQLIIAGLSNEEFASKLRTVPYPFKEVNGGTSIEIYHGAHGQLETRSPVRTFATYAIGNEPHLLAAYTCTPLVKIPLSKLKGSEKIMGDTVAELGAGNQPLDMVVYKKEGRDFVLMSNSSHGVLKVALDNVASVELIKEPVRGTAGLSFERISPTRNIQLDRLNETQAVMLAQQEGGGLTLSVMDLP